MELHKVDNNEFEEMGKLFKNLGYTTKIIKMYDDGDAMLYATIR